jgi:pimeloyl-ACP methyl ester carboxylesterase
VHGLGRTPLSLIALGGRLARAGAAPSYFAYYAWAQSHALILRRLTARLTALAALDRPVALVGHSLGGLLLRQAIPGVPHLKVSHLVMLGTPNRPPRLALRAQRWATFRLLTRSCGQLLATPEAFDALPAPAFPYTVLAGDRGGTGRWSPFDGERNDGFVALEETRVSSDEAISVFPVRHTFMMNNPAVQAAVVAALTGPSGAASGA